MSHKNLLAFVFVSIFGILSSSYLSAEEPSLLQGSWLTQKETKNAKIDIQPCAKDAQRLCGKIVWLEKPFDDQGQPKVDKNNPDPSLQRRSLLGLELLSGFHEKEGEPGVWEGGTIYNPEDGETYHCVIRLQKNAQGQDILHVRGYVGIPWFGKTQIWIRSNL